MKTIDTKSYLNTLCELIDQGKTVSTVVTGNSMSPFLIGNRDFVFLEKPDRNLKKGDIVLFRRANGNYVLHRIRYIRNGEYYLIGDRQNVTEGPIDRTHIFALVTSVKRKGKLLTPKHFIWKFFERIWLHLILLRPYIFRIISIVHKSAQKILKH